MPYLAKSAVFCKRMLTAAAFLVILLVIQPVSAQEDCGEPFATSDAVCNFTEEINED